jgi:hypothetical protein
MCLGASYKSSKLEVPCRMFHGFGQAKFAYGFRLKTIFFAAPAASKMTLDLKAVKLTRK